MMYDVLTIILALIALSLFIYKITPFSWRGCYLKIISSGIAQDRRIVDQQGNTITLETALDAPPMDNNATYIIYKKG